MTVEGAGSSIDRPRFMKKHLIGALPWVLEYDRRLVIQRTKLERSLRLSFYQIAQYRTTLLVPLYPRRPCGYSDAVRLYHQTTFSPDRHRVPRREISLWL